MNAIKMLLGFVMLAVAIATIARILPGAITMVLWALLMISVASTLRVFSRPKTALQRIGNAVGLLCFIYGILLMLGALLGQTNPLKPIPRQSLTENKLVFHRITSLAQLNEQRALAKKENTPLLLDFFATWCITCHELDQYTFSDPRVQNLLKSYRLVRADVTANSKANQALEKYLDVIAPPTILFFARSGKEIKNNRVVGSITADQLVLLLQQAIAR